MGLHRFAVVSCEYFSGGTGTVWASSVLVRVWVSFVDDAEAGASVDRKRWSSATGHGADGCVNSNQLLHQLDILTPHIHLQKSQKCSMKTIAWKRFVKSHPHKLQKKKNTTGKRIIKVVPSQLSTKPEPDWSFLLRKPYPLNEKQSTTEYLKNSSSGNCDKYENSYKCQTSLPSAFIDLSACVDTAFGEWNVCDEVSTPPVLSDITVNKLSCDIYGRLKIRRECIRSSPRNGN